MKLLSQFIVLLICNFLPDTAFGQAVIEITTPAQSEIIREKSFTLRVTMNGEVEDLDHIHYQVDVVGGEASGTKHTTPDITGTVDIDLPLDAKDGEYEVCVKMARIDHSKIGEVVCSTFNLVTSGFDLINPIDNAILDSFDFEVQLSQFGEKEISNILYIVNSGNANTVENINQAFSVVANQDLVPGGNIITIWGEGNFGQQIGYTIVSNFNIDSGLNADNLKNSIKLVKKFRKSLNLKLVKKALKIINLMRTGGSQHPDLVKLNSKGLVKVKKVLKKLLANSIGTKKISKQALRKLKQMQKT